MPPSPSDTCKSASTQNHQHTASSCDDPARVSSMTASSSSSSSSTPTSNGHTVSMSGLKSTGQSHTSGRHSPLACNGPSSLSSKNSRLNSSPSGPGLAGHSKPHLSLHHSQRIPSPSHRKSLSPQSANLVSSAHPVSSLLMNGTNATNSPSSHAFSGLSSDHLTSTQAGVFGYAMAGSNCARQLTKLRRLLETLHKFAADTSPEMGKKVHSLIIALVGGQLLLEDFHYKIQEVTRYPLRSYVIHFLRLNLPLLQGDLLRGARASKTSLIQYVHQNEALIFDSSSSSLTDIGQGEAFDIFQPEVMLTRKEASPLNSHKIPGESSGKRENIITVDERSCGEPLSKRHSAGLGVIGTNLTPNNMALLHVQPPASVSRQHLVTSHCLPHLPLRRAIIDDISSSSSATSSSTPQYFHSPHNPTISDCRTAGSASINPEHYLDRVHSANDLYEKDLMTNSRSISHSLHPITLHRTLGDDAMTANIDDDWHSVNSMIHHITFLLDRTKKSLASLQSRFIELTSANQLIPSPTTARNRNMNFPPPPLDSNSHLRPVDQPVEQCKSRDQPMPSPYLTENSATKNQISNEVERIPTAVGRPLANGIKDIKRQQVADLQKAIVADNKANELVAVERAKMEKMITEVRRQAAEEALASINRQENREENCWNCGRKASETCSGCNVARYCGAFCQHKDWENHHRVCGTGRDIANNGTITEVIHSPSHTPANDSKRKHGKSSADGTNGDDVKARTVNGDTREVSD